MPEFNPSLLLSPDHWFDKDPGPLTVLYAIPAGILVVTFLFSLFIYLRRREIYAGHALHIKLARIVTSTSMTISGIGILLLLARAAEMTWISMRFLLYLDLLALIALFIYFKFYYLAYRYPNDLAYYEKEERRRRYIPAGALPTPSITMHRRASRRR